MAFSSYVSQALAAWINGKPMPAAPTGLVIALSVTDPLADGSGLSEPAGANGYARQPVTLNAALQADGSVLVTSTNAVVFGAVTNQNWPTVAYGALLGADGSLIVRGKLGIQRTAPVGDNVSFGVGAFQFVIT